MLIALMACWAAQGHPVYSFMLKDGKDKDHQTILYISDIGATNLQPIFIACAGAQGICYVLSLTAERYLRHAGRLLPNWNRTEKIMSGCAIAFGIIGQLGILFVSIFNTNVFPHVHVAMLCVFIVGVGISTLFTIAEFVLLDRNYSGIRQIRISYILKAIWFIVCLALAIAFATCSSPNAAAVCEWTLSFVYGLYLCLFAYDLSPAARNKKGAMFEDRLSHQINNWTSRDSPEHLTRQAPMNDNESLERSPIGELVMKERDGMVHM